MELLKNLILYVFRLIHSDNKRNIGNMENMKLKGIRQTNNPPKDLSNTYLKNETHNSDDDLISEDIPENLHNETNEGNMIDFEADNHNNENEELIQSQVSVEDLIQENDNLIAENEKLTKEVEELKDHLLRKVAEFENFRKRTLKEKEDLIHFANAQLLFKLLDLVDNIEKAYNSAKESHDYESLLKGIELISQQANKILQDEDVSPIPINIGDDFNVDTQDALMTIDSELPEGKVAMILQKGYQIKDKVLRHAKVAVSQGNDDK